MYAWMNKFDENWLKKNTCEGKLDDELLKQLECPVCLEYMESHIKMCENGHNICTSCRSRVELCPSCRGQFLQVRNIALESLARTAMYPCKNREAGCNKIFSIDQRNDHQSKCPYQRIKCPFKKLFDKTCPWTGDLYEVEEHVRLVHGRKILQKVEPFSVELENICSPKLYYKLIYTLDTLFYLVWEIKDATLYFSAFYVAKEDEEFRYKFKIQNSQESISIRGTCHSYLQNKHEVFKPGECLSLHYGTVLKYLTENNTLFCKIEIVCTSLERVTYGLQVRSLHDTSDTSDTSDDDW